MPNILYDLSVDRVDLVTEGCCSEAHIKLFKNKEGGQAMNFDEIISKMKPEHAEVIKAELEKAKQPNDATTAELETFKKQCEDTQAKLDEVSKKLEETEEELEKVQCGDKVKKNKDYDEVLKSLDPDVQEFFNTMKKQKEAAEAIAKSAQEERIAKEAILKAADLKALPVEEKKLIEMIKKGISDEVLEVLKSAAKACEDADIFKAKGTDGDNGKSSGADAWAKIEAKATEIAKEKNLTQAKAVDMVIKMHPEMYKEYIEGGAN